MTYPKRKTISKVVEESIAYISGQGKLWSWLNGDRDIQRQWIEFIDEQIKNQIKLKNEEDEKYFYATPETNIFKNGVWRYIEGIPKDEEPDIIDWSFS